VSLSRARLRWGVPVPWDESQVIYVWIDALLNYYTALSYAREGEDLTDRYWPARHLIGKDILKFHAVIWPAMLLAAGIEVPKSIFIHGYLLMDEHKMSKSLGNVIDPFEVMDRFGTDTLRYYLFREVNFGQDGSISAAGFETRYNAELANEYGNLASRTLAMIGRYRDGRLAPGQPNEELRARLQGLQAKLVERFDAWDLTAALEDIWEVVRWLNRHVEDTAPWQLAKDESKADELSAVLYDLAEGVRAVAVALSPYLPETAPRILGALRQPVDLSLEQVAYGKTGATEGIEPATPLFPRVDLPTAAA
jgi:methionyl-tRNA synthetase